MLISVILYPTLYPIHFSLRGARHYTDALLVAVVGLCTLENDVIHAAYLALALLLFRRRGALRLQGNALFRWLPAYNFGVMALTLLYQAPFGDVWGRRHGPRLVRGLSPGCIGFDSLG